jgi:hypothetical protein
MGFASLYPSYELPVGQNTPPPVNPSAQKYFTLPKFGITAYIDTARPDEEGRFASRSKRGPGCGGRGSVVRERRGQGG